MTLRQTIQAAPTKANELISKLSATSNQAVKTRESLFSELSDELSRYVELEEQHLLPLLRKHAETKDLAAATQKGNKDLRAQLAKLSGAPKDNDEFLSGLAELKKGFQEHVRNERKELLPAVINALSAEEASELAQNIDGAVAEAEKAKRDEKREAANQARKEEQLAQQAAEAQRAEVRAQKAAERSAREATEKLAESVKQGAASAQEGVRRVTSNVMEQAQRGAVATQEAVAVFGSSMREAADGLRAVAQSSNLSAQATSEMSSILFDWTSKAVRLNAETAQRMLQSKNLLQLAEAQRDFVGAGFRIWTEGRAQLLQLTQRSSKMALRPLDERLTDAG